MFCARFILRFPRKHSCICRRWSLALLGGVLLAWHFGNTGNKIQDIKAPLDLMVGLLRMLIFAVTAGFAQLLGIGWRNKVLQLATGLSFYSAVDLIVSLVAALLRRLHGTWRPSG